MSWKIINKIRGRNTIYGPCAGGNMHIDKLQNIEVLLFQDTEREFVVTHRANIKPVAYFDGRETECQDLRQRIEEGRKSVLVSGMGGIGKTHICRKLFQEYVDKKARNEEIPFCHIGYVEYDGNMGSSLQNCLKYKPQKDPQLNQEAAWRELEFLASDGKLLLFVDNVNTPIGQDPGLERLRSIPGAVILTSRMASFSREFEPYRLGFLSVEQCKKIYAHIRYGGSGKEVSAEEITDLEYIIEQLAARHTLTVENLAHLARTKLWSMKRLRQELEKKGFRLEYRDENSDLMNIQKSYETLYDLSDLTDAEQNILEAFSVFPYIPLPAEVCNEWLLSDAGLKEEDDALIGLYRKGWLQFDFETDCFSMHPVFAQFIYEKCKPKWNWHHGLIKACHGSIRIPEENITLECERFIPFAESIVEKVDLDTWEEQVVFIGEIAFWLNYISEYEEAKKMYERYLELCRKIFGDSDITMAKAYNNLAGVYARMEEYERAESLYEESLRINKAQKGEKDPDTIKIYNNLAYIYDKMGEDSKAEDLYEKSLKFRLEVFGEKALETASSYNNLGGFYESRKKYKQAEDLYKKSLQIRETTLGSDHTLTAISYNNLAGISKRKNDYKTALGYCIKAYEVFLRTLGWNNSNTQIIVKNMKQAYTEVYNTDDFEQWLEEQMKE